jgi:hypothetical protein
MAQQKFGVDQDAKTAWALLSPGKNSRATRQQRISRVKPTKKNAKSQRCEDAKEENSANEEDERGVAENTN